MNFIINEDRICNLIIQYIDSIVGDVFIPTKKSHLIDWSDENGHTYIRSYKIGKLVVDEDLYDEVKDMFNLEVSIKNHRFLNECFIKWFNNKQNLISISLKTPSTTVTTF